MNERELSEAIMKLSTLRYSINKTKFVMSHNNMHFDKDCDDVSSPGAEAPHFVNERGGIRVNGLRVFSGRWLIDGPWKEAAESSVRYLTNEAESQISREKLERDVAQARDRAEAEHRLQRKIADATALFDRNDAS